MSSSDSKQESSSVVQTITPTIIGAQGGTTTSTITNVSGGIKAGGDIGLTGKDAVRILSDFQELQRDQALLNAQNLANTSALLGSYSGGGSATFLQPSLKSEKTDDEKNERFSNLTLVLGGVAAVATLFAIMK